MIWIDIDMPKNCRDCPLHDVDEEQCPIYSIYKDDYDKSRFDKCPLHEITADPDTISRKQAIDALESDYAYAAAKIIKALPPSPSRLQWIPCSERLPDEHKSVLCCTYGGTHFIGYIKEAKQGEYMAVSGDSDYKTVYEIVAWMPKPETYKGVDA